MTTAFVNMLLITVETLAPGHPIYRNFGEFIFVEKIQWTMHKFWVQQFRKNVTEIQTNEKFISLNIHDK